MYNFAILDPRPQGAEANDKVLDSTPFGVMGIEVTIPEMSRRCRLGNIDPQHGNHIQSYDNGTGYMEWDTHSKVLPGETAIEFAARQNPYGYTMVPPAGSTLVTIRPDLDSVGAMAVLSMLIQGVNLEPAKDRIAAVAAADKFAKAGWPGPRPLPTKDNSWPEETAGAESSRLLAAIAAAVADFKVPLAERVTLMEQWLLTGQEPVRYREQIERERSEMIVALESGNIRHETVADGKVAVVNSTHRSATMIGYMLAPVVVALNPAFRVGGGEPHLKFTVCQFMADYVDLKGVASDLNQLEPGWGGSATIIGSPQGLASKLTTEQVVEVVTKHLK